MQLPAMHFHSLGFIHSRNTQGQLLLPCTALLPVPHLWETTGCCYSVHCPPWDDVHLHAQSTTCVAGLFAVAISVLFYLNCRCICNWVILPLSSRCAQLCKLPCHWKLSRVRELHKLPNLPPTLTDITASIVARLRPYI